MKWMLLLLFFPWVGKAVSQEKSSELLFYIDRNLNKNRVVYEANFGADGMLKAADPIKTHWVMYENSGEDEPLNYIEKHMAYGVKCIKNRDSKILYRVELVADKTRTFLLRQKAPFEAQVTTVLEGVTVVLSRLFIEADNSMYWPKVNYILIEGRESESQKLISEKYLPEN